MYRLIDSHLQTSLRHIRVTEDTYNRMPFHERRLYAPEKEDQRFTDLGKSLLDHYSDHHGTDDLDFDPPSTWPETTDGAI